MTVRALLKGDEFDLQTLVDMFPEGDPCAVKAHEDWFHLEATELDPGPLSGNPNQDVNRDRSNMPALGGRPAIPTAAAATTSPASA